MKVYAVNVLEVGVLRNMFTVLSLSLSLAMLPTLRDTVSWVLDGFIHYMENQLGNINSGHVSRWMLGVRVPTTVNYFFNNVDFFMRIEKAVF